jgi:hypothetical protein
MVEVVNMRNTPDFGSRPGDVRIDRRTKWGNPFPMRGEATRNLVCDQYEKWFEEQEHLGRLDINELHEARRLGCWCKPKRCHGDYLRMRIEKLHGGRTPYRRKPMKAWGEKIVKNGTKFITG